jgi:hypothetical protein
MEKLPLAVYIKDSNNGQEIEFLSKVKLDIWLLENCVGNYYRTRTRVLFEKQEDALMYKMVWCTR